MAVTRVSSRTVDAEPLELPLGRRRAIGRVGRQDPIHRLDEDDRGVARVDRPEVALERVARDLAEGAGELDPGRAATDEHEGHPLAPPVRVGFPFRGLERDEDAPPDLGRVLEGLEPRARRRPLVVPEVRVVGAGRDDERVVPDRPAVGHLDLAPIDIDPDGLAEDDRGIALSRRIERSGWAISPGESAPVATWYSIGWNRWKLRRSRRVTATSGSLLRLRAAYSPPNPPPTMRTRWRVRSVAPRVTRPACRQDPVSGLRRRRAVAGRWPDA